MNLYKLIDKFAIHITDHEVKKWIENNVVNPYNNCFFYSAVICLLFPGYKLIRGEHSKQSKEDTAHFYVKNESGKIIDPTEKQYQPGVLKPGKEVSAIKNIDFVINDPLFETLSKKDKKKINLIYTNRNI